MNFDNPYRSTRSPVFARNIVATSHPLAAQAGLRILAAGGNAVDAAIATAACMPIVEPCSNGLGSDAFALVWRGGRLHGLNGSGRAPAGLDRSRLTGRTMPVRGWDAVTVPGQVALWADMHARFGRLPFAALLGPAAAALSVSRRGWRLPAAAAHAGAAAARAAATALRLLRR